MIRHAGTGGGRVAKWVAVCAIIGAAAPAAYGYDPANGEWTRSSVTYVRVMTWNLEKGLGPGVDTTPASPTQIGSAYDYIGRIAQAMDPDVIALQEVQYGSVSNTTQALQDWADQFFGAGTFNVYVSSETDNWNRNAILSRYPFASLNGWPATLPDMPAMVPGPGGVPPGVDGGGIRGWAQAGIDLPDAVYTADLLVTCSHLKSGGGSDDKQQRLDAAQNIAYYVNYALNTTLDPDSLLPGQPPSALSAETPVILMGDMNEDENTNGRDGPVKWMAEWHPTVADDGTDKDWTPARPDLATEPFTGTRDTHGNDTNSKLDYVISPDSVVNVVEEFVFWSDYAAVYSALPPQLEGLLNANLASYYASDHRPVIVDLRFGDEDYDGDNIPDPVDNCPLDYNPLQEDGDMDGVGDVCDGCPADPNKTEPGQCGCGNPDTDSDGDDVADCVDVCPGGDDTQDADGDAIPDDCDDCTDPDNDGYGNPGTDQTACTETGDDNCPEVYNPGQEDCDGDSIGDVCDAQTDSDHDGHCNTADNCPWDYNPGQEDADMDGVGNACDDCPNEPALVEPSEVPEQTCDDGIDNDCDGTTDGDDTNCQCICGDLDGDAGTVDLADFNKFSVCFGLRDPTAQCPQELFECADLNLDGWINLTDFSTFSVVFGGVSTSSPPNCN